MSASLLIDDDEELLKSLSGAAKLAGFEILIASTWDEGLGLFEAFGPRLVVADYHMPNSRHGLQLLAEVKRLRPSVRVILLSAYINDDDVDAIMKLQLIDRVLRKLDLLQTMDALLNEFREASTGTEAPTDWVGFAEARMKAASSSRPALEQLDQLFTQHRAPRS